MLFVSTIENNVVQLYISSKYNAICKYNHVLAHDSVSGCHFMLQPTLKIPNAGYQLVIKGYRIEEKCIRFQCTLAFDLMVLVDS